MPQFEKIWKELKDKNVSFVAIEAFEDTERAKRFINDKGLSFIFLEDKTINGEKTYQKYGVSAFPTTFLFSKNGKLIEYHLGYEKGMEGQIKEKIIEALK